LSPHAIVGNAKKAVEYPANGEAADWFLYEKGVISLSPELGYEGYRPTNFPDSAFHPDSIHIIPTL